MYLHMVLACPAADFSQNLYVPYIGGEYSGEN